MESRKTAAVTTGTNKLKLRFLDQQKTFGEYNNFGNEFKKFETGLGFGVVSQCGKSIDINNTHMIFKPTEDLIYIYAKCPIKGGKGDMVQSNIELFDTDTHYLMLIKRSTYQGLTI